MTKKIIIIGSGWYGCHIALLLNNYKDYDITIIEKNDNIFDNSSYYNQNRLHSGYHYCRNYPTRNLCKKYYDKFIQQYSQCVDNIRNNYYVISNHSLMDYKTYTEIYEFEKFKFDIVKNNIFQNIDEDLIRVKEEVINSDKVKKMFENKLLNLDNVHFLFNTKVLSVEKKQDIINVNCENEKIYSCDLLLDCTYNQLQLSKKEYKYEQTLSLIIKKLIM